MGAPKGHKAYPGSGQPKKYTKEVIEAWADKLLEWSLTPNATQLINFCAHNIGFHHRLFSEFAQVNEKYNEALYITKCRIGERRANLAAADLLDKWDFKSHQHMYDPLNHSFHRDEKEFDAALAVKYKSAQDKYYESLLDNLPDTSKLA